MYTVAIIGGGAISCGYDSPNDENILTHIHGALLHSNIELDAIVETDEKRQKYIIDKWGTEFDIFSSLEDFSKKYRSDIIIVATPTSTHFDIIENILSIYEPKLIICEKPIVSSSKEFEMLNALLDNTNVKIITHYTRRFDPSINKLKDILHNIGEINHFYGTFTKGLFHNGSHMMDLLTIFFEKINHINVIEKEVIDNDVFGKFTIKTNKCSGIISNINNNNLSLFELIIYTEKAKIEITGPDQEIVIHYIDESEKFNGYKSFSKKEVLPNTLSEYAYNLLEYIDIVIKNETVYSTLKLEQYLVNEFIFKIQTELLEKQ